jgi:hypothetical protein
MIAVDAVQLAHFLCSMQLLLGSCGLRAASSLSSSKVFGDTVAVVSMPMAEPYAVSELTVSAPGAFVSADLTYFSARPQHGMQHFASI